jgi:hypothetical protein
MAHPTARSRPRFWFASAFGFALLAVGLAFTVFGEIAESLAAVCLISGGIAGIVLSARNRQTVTLQPDNARPRRPSLALIGPGALAAVLWWLVAVGNRGWIWAGILVVALIHTAYLAVLVTHRIVSLQHGKAA